MALTDIEKVRFEIGLVGDAENLVTDAEIEYKLETNKGNIKQTSLEIGHIVLFILAQRLHERADVLEIWGHDWFNNYHKALQLYITNQNKTVMYYMATPFAGGIYNDKIRENIEDSNINSVNVDMGVPTDGILTQNNNKSIFKHDDGVF